MNSLFWMQKTFVPIAAAVLLSSCAEQAEIPSQPVFETVEVRAESPAIILPPRSMLAGGKAHFKKRVGEIEALPRLEGGVLLAGDSITEAWLWHTDKLPFEVSNHGIGWDTAEGLKSRLPLMLRHNPDQIFLMIGTNDIGYGHSADHVARYVKETVEALRSDKPDAEIYLQAIFPREEAALEKVRAYNAALNRVAQTLGVDFVDMTGRFEAPDGTLKSGLTDDGLHLNAKGYDVWAEFLNDIVKSSQNPN